MHLLWEERGKVLTATFKPIKGELAKYVFSPTAIRLLELLDKPRTLSELARELNTTPQNVYYHLKRLKAAGSVRETKEGYVRTADAFGVVLGYKEARRRTTPGHVSKFFAEFVNDGTWNSLIVVGSPDPHGYYLQRARDGHYSAVLGAFLGRYFDIRGFPVRIDTDVSYLWRERNLVLIGGPVSNTVTFELIEERKVFFSLEKPWMLKGKRQYTGENIGLIAKINVGGHWYILFAGVSALGTKSAIFALTSLTDEILGSYPGGEYYWIVEGLDKDGDGTIDMIKVLERGPIKG